MRTGYFFAAALFSIVPSASASPPPTVNQPPANLTLESCLTRKFGNSPAEEGIRLACRKKLDEEFERQLGKGIPETMVPPPEITNPEMTRPPA